LPTRPPTSTPFPYTTLFRSDLDLLSERDPPVPGEVDRQRPGRRTRRRVFRDTARGREHARLPILAGSGEAVDADLEGRERAKVGDRKSTRLNSSHQIISYAV